MHWPTGDKIAGVTQSLDRFFDRVIFRAMRPFSRERQPNSPKRRNSGVHVFAADLDVEAVGVFGVEAVFGVGADGQVAALEFGLDGVLVPIFDSVGHVVDAGDGGAGAGVAGQQEGVSEGKVALAPIVMRYLHAEEIGVEVAGLGVVGHLVRNVVDGHSFEAFAPGGPCGGGSGCRQGETLDKLAAIHLSLFEIVEQSGDDMFHVGSPSVTVHL
ncbi:hypothetical protein SBA3_2310046 [Candidatus Sulfopaludibacter sp. SbA3]|nr:hypothetical protein SBA3_2310046 [Candidatus Sulfopaludibacter sp. SbA3]